MKRALLLLLLLASPLGAQEDEPRDYGVAQSWTSRDKLYHFGVSAAGAGATYALARALGVKRWPAVALSVGITGGAGVLREYQDRRKPSKYFSEKDLLWNAVGITVGIAIPDRFLFPRRREKEPDQSG